MPAMRAARIPGWQPLIDLGLPMRWSTLRDGLRGVPLARRLLTVGDVAAWAARVVEDDLDQPDEVFALLALPPGTGNDRDMVAEVAPLLEALAADEPAGHGDRAWRLVEIAALTERIAAWPVGDDRDDSDPACEIWSACREIWSAWPGLDRPAIFFTAAGGEGSCYCGRGPDAVLADYRAWLAAEVAGLTATGRER